VPGAADLCPQGTQQAEQLLKKQEQLIADAATPSCAFFKAVYERITGDMCVESGKRFKFEIIILNHLLKVSFVNRPDKVTGEQIRDRKTFVLHRPLSRGAHEGDTHAIKAWASVQSYFGK